MNELKAEKSVTISPEALAQLGGGHIAYMKALKGEEVNALFPQAPEFAPDHKLWALLAADGTPIVLADNPHAVAANAAQNNLAMVSVH